MQTFDNISVQSAPPKVPAKSSYDKFGKDTQIGHFLRFCKGGPREIRPKSGQTSGLKRKICANCMIF